MSRWTRRYGFAFRLAGCFGIIFAASAVVGLENCGNLIWVANGLALSYLLLAPRWLWKYYLAVTLVAMFAGGLVVDPGRWSICAALTVLNTGEAALGAFALRRRSTQLPRFADQRYLLRFAVFAVLGAPAAIAMLFGATYLFWMEGSPWHPMLNWISTDGLGTAIVAPACVSLYQSHLKCPGKRKIHYSLLVALVPITIGAFIQTHAPLLFLIYPIVALILFRFGLGWASMSTLYVAVVGSWCTIHGFGPFAKISATLSRGPTVLLQFYLASGMFLIFAAASVLETLHATERRLREIVYLHQLVTENSRDIIILADFEGNRSYVSASAANWGDWERDELLGMNSLALVHPDDRAKAEAVVSNLRAGGDGALIECRVRDKNGDYHWVEANLRPVRSSARGAPIGILNIVRDISKRKQAEEELVNAYAAVEALAVTDPLTHLPNRRRFDQYLSDEWRRAMRDHLPLSLLFLDADWFKSYNDIYGHLRGDSCLKQISEAALDVVHRSGDLVARTGGEEFAVILPNTHNQGALEVAKQICDSLRHRKLPHESNPAGYVTISIGCATVVPEIGQHSIILMQMADEALYAAKHAGRDRVCNAIDVSVEHHTPQSS